MELKKFLAEQLVREAATSRKVIERVPEGNNSRKPHEKSMELGYLAALVAGMPAWPAMMIDYDEIDLDGNGKTFRTQAVETRAELIMMIDEGLKESLKA